MLSATRLMGAYGQNTVRAAGLKVSLAGLGILRILMSADGLKATEVADRAWSSPGTQTSVVNTLVRDGFVERKPDQADRRVVRLYITDGAVPSSPTTCPRRPPGGVKHSASSTATTRPSSAGSSSR
jgi:MarR family